ncbi:hypothetical protein T484DRAFT_1834442 [Baffinella frigidus]|nr:hypothetical protein T484DRAFT_1834442 [Cryptophyta sp. CCMP2293]
METIIVAVAAHPPTDAPAALYEDLETAADPSVFPTASSASSPHPVEPSVTLKPSDGPVGHGTIRHDGALPPPAPFCKSRKCVAMAVCCCGSSCVILLAIALAIVLPIVAFLSTAQESAPNEVVLEAL